MVKAVALALEARDQYKKEVFVCVCACVCVCVYICECECLCVLPMCSARLACMACLSISMLNNNITQETAEVSPERLANETCFKSESNYLPLVVPFLRISL